MSTSADNTTRDPICGRPVDPLRARAVGIFGGATYYFCSAECKAQYADPRRSSRALETSALPTDKPPSPDSAARITRASPTPPAPEPIPVERTDRVVRIDSPRSHPTLLAGAITLVVAVGAYLWWSGREQAVGSATVGTSGPVATPEAIAKPMPVATPPKTATSSPAPAVREQVISGVVPPVKLGLRRFRLAGDQGSVTSLRLLVIDGANHATPVDVVTLPTDEAPSEQGEAVTPSRDFVSSSTELGTIFEETLRAGARSIDVRVTRSEDGVLAESREGEGAWQVRVRVPMSAGAALRAAAFSNRRYQPEAAEAE
jgi:Cu+-exporting ATPase